MLYSRQTLAVLSPHGREMFPFAGFCCLPLSTTAAAPPATRCLLEAEHVVAALRTSVRCAPSLGMTARSMPAVASLQQSPSPSGCAAPGFSATACAVWRICGRNAMQHDVTTNANEGMEGGGRRGREGARKLSTIALLSLLGRTRERNRSGANPQKASVGRRAHAMLLVELNCVRTCGSALSATLHHASSSAKAAA